MTRLSASDRVRVLKHIDSAWTVVLIDPLGLWVLPRIVRLPRITPIRLTALAQLTGLAAAVAFGFGHLVVAAILFEVRFFVDCLDGKLARLRGQTSRFGALLDSQSDRIVVLASFVALAAWAQRPWLAALLAGVHPISFALRDQRDTLYAELGSRKPIDVLELGGAAAWLRRNRIYPTVTTIEVEHAVLFVVPLLTAVGVDLVVPALAAAGAYFGLQGARFGAATLREAARADRAAASVDPDAARSR